MIQKYSKLHLGGATTQQLESVSKRLGIPVETVKSLANDADPTPEKKFESWVVKQMFHRNIRLPEDASRVEILLQDFVTFSNKKKLKHRDIAAYPKIHDLEAEIDSLKETSEGVGGVLTVETLQKLPGVKIFETPSRVFAAVSDASSLEFLGLGTKWCTRADAPGGSRAKGYLRDARSTNSLFLGFNRVGDRLEKLYQFTEDLDQLMDIRDTSIDWDYAFLRREGILDMFQHFGWYLAMIRIAKRYYGNMYTPEAKEFADELLRIVPTQTFKEFLTFSFPPNKQRWEVMTRVPDMIYYFAAELNVPILTQVNKFDVESLKYPMLYALKTNTPLDFGTHEGSFQDAWYGYIEDTPLRIVLDYFNTFIDGKHPDYLEWLDTIINAFYGWLKRDETLRQELFQNVSREAAREAAYKFDSRSVERPEIISWWESVHGGS